MCMLDDYISQLAQVHEPADLNFSHADWIWDRRDDVASTVEKLNRELGFTERGQFQPHIMTTSVGDASGLLFVSANPGWKLLPSTKEDSFRRAICTNNRDFCRDFFNIFPREVGRNRWWSRALLLANLVDVGEPVLGQHAITPRERWAWVQARGLASGVSNVDLIPFHSTRDEFKTLSDAHINTAQQTLRNVATATLEMVLRLQPAPKLILIASKLGAELMDDFRVSQNLMEVNLIVDGAADPCWQRLRGWVHPNTGAKVMAFPSQVFAANASFNLPRGFMYSLAELMRNFTDARGGG